MSLIGNEGGSGEGNGGGTSGAGGSGAGGAGSGGSGAAASGGGASGSSGAGGTPSWRDSLPEEMRANPTLSKYSDLSSFAKAHVELQGFVGKKGIFPPGDKATPEQWKEFYKAAGQPEFDKFDVKAPEGKKLNPVIVDGFKKLAHENGLMPKQAQGLMDWFINQEETSAVASKAAREQQVTEGLNSMRKEWGDGFDRKVEEATTFVKELGGQEAVDYFVKSGLGKDPQILKLLAKAAPLLGEDKLRGDGGGRMGAQTPAEIQSEIDKVRGDLKHPYYDKTHAGHQSAQKHMEELYKKLYTQKSG